MVHSSTASAQYGNAQYGQPYPQQNYAPQYAQRQFAAPPQQAYGGAFAPVSHTANPAGGGYPFPTPQGHVVINPSGPFPLATPEQSHTPRAQDLPVANMVGDSLGGFGSANFNFQNLATMQDFSGSFDLPIGGRIAKIAENNSPIPRDRVYFSYNHFHNAYDLIGNFNGPNPDFDPMIVDPDDPRSQPFINDVIGESVHQNRFTLGIEKTLFFDDMSLELRVPLVNQASLETTNAEGSFVAASEDPNGDLGLNFKQILYDWNGNGPNNSSGVVSWGVGLSFPTAEGATIDALGTRFQVEDSAIHFLPYLAFVFSHDNGLFMQGFFQLDISNDAINVKDSQLGRVGSFQPANTANIDLGLGYWLFHNRQRRFLRGVAPILEFHCTSQIQDTESLSFTAAAPGGLSSVININDPERSSLICNLTSGFHFDLSEWANMRAACVAPLRGEPEREFDASFVLQLDLTR